MAAAGRWALAVALSLMGFAQLMCACADGSHNNWAVLVCTSRYWFNYRHVANALSFYHTVKRLGIPDSKIILMLADDMPCNPRNSNSAKVYNNMDHRLNIYGDSVEVDYRGAEVTVENFLRVMTGRHADEVPRSQRLLSDEDSNILLFMTGHGGADFLKFQDQEELQAWDLADALQQMHVKKRYKEVLFMIDTCQASTMYRHIYSPNVIGVGSSRKGQSSYSHHADPRLGLTVIDRFTHYTLETLEKIGPESKALLITLLKSYTYDNLHSTVEYTAIKLERPLSSVLLTDFFASATLTHFIPAAYPLPLGSDEEVLVKPLRVEPQEVPPPVLAGSENVEAPTKHSRAKPGAEQEQSGDSANSSSLELMPPPERVAVAIVALGLSVVMFWPFQTLKCKT